MAGRSIFSLRALRGLPGAQILNAFAANAQFYKMDYICHLISQKYLNRKLTFSDDLAS
jgi:hypothetical protein